MRRQTRSPASRALALIAFIAALVGAAAAQERDRTKIPDQFKWNLTEIYASEAAWRAGKDKLAADLPQLRQFQGRLASSAATLVERVGQRRRRRGQPALE